MMKKNKISLLALLVMLVLPVSALTAESGVSPHLTPEKALEELIYSLREMSLPLLKTFPFVRLW